jgi:outer membrane protein TolC
LHAIAVVGALLASLTFSGRARAQVDIALPTADSALDVEFNELLERFASSAPEIVRGRFSVEQARAQVDGSLALLDYALAARFNATRAEQPTNDGLSSGLSTNERYQLGADLTRRFRPGTQVQLSVENSVTSSSFPFSSPAGTQIIERGPNFETALTLSASQPLLEGFGERIYMLPLTQAQRRMDAAELGVVQQASARLLELMTGSVELAYSLEEVEVRHNSLRRTLEQMLIADAELQAGRIAAIDQDLLRQRAAANQEAILVSWANAQARTRNLRGVIGELPVQTEVWSISPPAPVLESEVAGAVCAAASEYSPDVATLRAQLETARLDVVRTSDTLRPQLDVSAGITQRGLDANVPGALGQMARLEATTLFGGLTLTVPLGNRQARSESSQARVAVERAMFEISDMERTLCTQVHELVQNLSLLTSRAELATYRIGIAQRALAAEQARFAQGLSTVQNGLQALEDLETAELEGLRIETDVELARWRLLHLSGGLMARWLPSMETLFGPTDDLDPR